MTEVEGRSFSSTEETAMSGCCHGWDAQRGEGCPEGPGCNEPVPYPLYAFCAEQLPDDWREMSSGSVALAILTAAADPAAPGRSLSSTGVAAMSGDDHEMRRPCCSHCVHPEVLFTHHPIRCIRCEPMPWPVTSAGGTMNGTDLITAERQRQIEQEGWTPEHDAGHTGDHLARAATCYATPPDMRSNFGGTDVPGFWPWESRFWKPTPDDRVRELVKAGALIAAEIDRLQARDG